MACYIFDTYCNISTSRSCGRTINKPTLNPSLGEVANRFPNRCSDRKFKKRQNLTSKQTEKLSRCFSRNKESPVLISTSDD